MYNIEEIKEKASLCLNCKVPMCSNKGCPISTRIPEFISKIKENKLEEAYQILQENNILSEICSRVCPVEQQCMSKCVRGIKGEPVQINVLEQFINDWAKENNIKYNVNNAKEEINEKVAIIGSGPAGMACAVDLKKAGIKTVTIFEKEEKCGGILEYGIPDFRLSKDLVQSVINKIKEIGIEIKNKIEFGKDITLEDLKKQGYSKVFIGTGASVTTTYKLSEKHSKNIYQSDDFLKLYNIGKPVQKLGTVAVIGGGNVAIDSARVAKRTGAKEVYILYRRNEEFMPACKSELEDALKDGVQIKYLTRVIYAKVEDGKVKELNCIKTKIKDAKAVDIENSEFKIKADTVIFAIGSKVDKEFFSSMGIKVENGLIEVNKEYETNKPSVYAGGDLVENKSSVARAINTGKRAAQTIINECKKG